MKAVIFTSERELPWARVSRDCLAEQFEVESLIVSSLPEDKNINGLVGDKTARAMCRELIDFADTDDDVMVRIDVDTKLSREGVKWLQKAENGVARGYLIRGRSRACNPFSATRRQLIKAQDLLQRTHGNGCSGCYICLALKRTGGFLTTPGFWVTPESGQMIDAPHDAHLATLPHQQLFSVRSAQLDRFWDTTLSPKPPV